MKVYRINRRLHLQKRPVSFGNIAYTSRFLLSSRIMILFAIACFIGVSLSSIPSGLDIQTTVHSHFASFRPMGIVPFFQLAVRFTLFDASLLLLTLFSALTFFCSAVLHFVCLFGGIVYGFCIGTVTSVESIRLGDTFVYVFFIALMAILFSLLCADLLQINHACISKPHHKSDGFFISPLIKRYIQISATAIIVFLALRLLYTLLLTLLHVQ